MKAKSSIIIAYFATLIILGYFIFPFWAAVLAAWATLVLLILGGQTLKVLPRFQQRIILLIAFGYPLIETAIKFILTHDLTSYSGEWLNRVEHLGFSFVFTLLLFPLLKSSLDKLTFPAHTLLWVGLVVILGNINEFAEFFLRTQWQLTDPVYYADTILDLAMNIIGGILGVFTWKVISRTQHDKISDANS